MMALRFTLSGVQTATCGDMTASTPKGPINRLARDMIAAGHDGDEIVEVYRGETLCFLPLPLRNWAHWTIRENDAGIRSVKWVAMPGDLHAPQEVDA